MRKQNEITYWRWATPQDARPVIEQLLHRPTIAVEASLLGDGELEASIRMRMQGTYEPSIDMRLSYIAFRVEAACGQVPLGRLRLTSYRALRQVADRSGKLVLNAAGVTEHEHDWHALGELEIQNDDVLDSGYSFRQCVFCSIVEATRTERLTSDTVYLYKRLAEDATALAALTDDAIDDEPEDLDDAKMPACAWPARPEPQDPFEVQCVEHAWEPTAACGLAWCTACGATQQAAACLGCGKPNPRADRTHVES